MIICGENPTKAMKEYMEEIFSMVIELYKSSVPELLSEAFNIDLEDVENMDCEQAKQKLNNLIIDYKSADSRSISYATPIGKENTLLEYTGRKQSNRNDILRIHLVDSQILGKSSAEDIKRTITESGLLKVVEDIDYVAHEIGHALDARIRKNNPSNIDSLVVCAQKLDEERKNEVADLDTGEAFAVSMEKVILDELKKTQILEKLGLSQFVSANDIDDLWKEKRTKRAGRVNIGQTHNGKSISKLDFCLIPYTIYSNNGIKELIDYLKRCNFYQIYSSIPSKSDSENVTKMCDIINSGKFHDLLIIEPENYISVYSIEEINKAFFGGMSVEDDNSLSIDEECNQSSSQPTISTTIVTGMKHIAESRLGEKIKSSTREIISGATQNTISSEFDTINK